MKPGKEAFVEILSGKITTIALPAEFVVTVTEVTLLYNPVLVEVEEGTLTETNSGAKIDKIDYTFAPSNLATSSAILLSI